MVISVTPFLHSLTVALLPDVPFGKAPLSFVYAVKL
jgi:hypothetical protein